MAHPGPIPAAGDTDWRAEYIANMDTAYDIGAAAIPKSTGTAKGDVIGFTASATPARLAGSGTDGYVLTYDSTTSTGLKWAAAPSASGNPYIVSVTANGSSDQSSTIQTVLDNLASNGHSYHIIIEDDSNPTGQIYINNKIRISTSNTTVTFRNQVKLGTGADPDGFGCLSILGTAGTTTTVTAATAVRGNSVITVGSAANLTVNSLIRIYDNDTSGGASSGDKSEMAEIIDISGTTVYLDHPLHQSFTGTVTCVPITPVTNSGFENVDVVFTGQQTAGFLFTMKYQYTRNCFARNVRIKGDKNNSWSREAINTRYSFKNTFDNCHVSFAWNYGVGSTYSYGFTADGSTFIYYNKCSGTYLRHAFAADKGSSGIIYNQCRADKVLASGFDLHGNWTRDVVYTGCVATASGDGYQANDGQHFGFLAGNTTFVNGVQYVTYTGCTAYRFVNYTTNTAGSGNAAGFGVVDGAASIVFQGCRTYESEQGWLVLSQVGSNPISNVGIYNCEFNNGIGAAQLPIYVTAGAAPLDVVGLTIDNFKVMNSATVAAMRVYGNASNTLTDIAITNCVWNKSQGTSGVHSIDCRYVDKLVITGCTFNQTRRGIALLSCVSAVVTGNTFVNLTEPNEVIRDSGGNTSMYFGRNQILVAFPSVYGTAPTSTTPYIDITAPIGRTTAQLPALTSATAGAQAFDTTLSKLVVWSGSAWVAQT